MIGGFIHKTQTVAWFLQRPAYWEHAGSIALRKVLPDYDSTERREASRKWAEERTLSVPKALEVVGLEPDGGPLAVDAALLEEANARAADSTVAMGGAADVSLLYAAVRLSGAFRVVETGVAYGWSSLAILSGLEGRAGATLISVDMPYPKAGNEAFVGIAVPERLRGPWQIVRKPDRRGLEEAIRRMGGPIDLCHYDSDKSYYGRRYGFRLMWDALRPGGVFISDDIQDNLAFKEWVEAHDVPFAVTSHLGKFVGVARKPQAD